MFATLASAKRITRFALGYLLLTGLVVGVWALFLPYAFYAAFPGFGHAWVSVFGPYNGHLIGDVGAAYLSFGAMAGLSLIRPDRVAPFAVGVVTLVFNVLHFAYHMIHLGVYAPVDQVLNVIALGLAVLCSAWLVTARAQARA